MGAFLESIVFWVVETVGELGYPGIFVMMFVESSFVPFPSEIVMVPAGYLVSQGSMDPALATATGLAGSLGGAFLNYALAVYLGRPLLERIGRYFLLQPRHFEHAERYFERHGEVTTFVGRLIPVIRQLISIPAGLARMRLARFGLYTGLGAGIWCAVLVAIGYVAGESEELWRPLLREVTGWMLVGLLGLVAAYIYLNRRWRRST